MKKFLVAAFATLSIMTITGNEAQGRTNPLVDFFTKDRNITAVEGLPFDKITPQDYEEAVKEGMEMQNREIAAIVNQRSIPTFENTVEALDRSGRLLTGAELALGNVEHATGDTTLQNIQARLAPALANHYTAIMLNEGLWQRVKAVYDNMDKDTLLNPEQRRLIQETYRSFESSGANLSGKDRERYAKLTEELSNLQIRFAQNLTNGMKSPDARLWLRGNQLSGLPESVKQAAREEAAAILTAEGKADDPDLYLFTVFFPSYSPLMKYADNREVREKMYRLYNSRNQKGEFDNTQILKDIANVRLEIANLLGYPNYAAYALHGKMAKDVPTVQNFLKELRDAYKPTMQKELAEITEYARKTQGDDFVLNPWDYSYWSNKLKNERYAFNDEDMRPYFELENTIKGVLGLATKLYGYKFKENKSLPVYNPEVKAFDVVGPDGKLLGLLYADFYYRPGKAPGAWMTEFRPESRDEKGNREYPIISIVCNFTKPVGSDPSLLNPYEVETFLHEFGHALHGLSANTTYSTLSGTNVYQDFVELFSQFNENYLTEKEYLDGFARHYKTGKKMPAELIERFIRSSRFGAAYACLRQLGFGELDMAYYTLESPMRASQSVADFENKALKDVQMFAPVDGCLLSPQFGHIFSGGYAAGYYGYKWSEVLDADAFAAFKETGIFNKKTANAFRKMLQSGGTVDPMELYMEFRGKKPTIDALLERDGIKK